jgi:sugar lactone lactonase YvrE
LYWTVTTGTHAYAVPTAVLKQHDSTDAQIAAQIQNLGTVGGNTDGLVTDAKGYLYITDVTHNGIVRYDPKTRKMLLIAANEAIKWPDTPAIRPDGDLIFTSSSLMTTSLEWSNQAMNGTICGACDRTRTRR